MSGKRRRPSKQPLVDEFQAEKSGGLNWIGRVGSLEESIAFYLSDGLFGVEQVRKDYAKIFPNRNEASHVRPEEEQFVASFQFPATRGTVRRVKIVAPIRDFVVKRGDSGLLKDDKERVFSEQAHVDFEQLCVDFMRNAIPALRQSAYLLSSLNNQHLASGQQRPKPTDREAFLATTEGRKMRERIVEAFAEIVDKIFPPLPGRPLEVAKSLALLSEYENLKAKYSGERGRAKREMMTRHEFPSLQALEKKLTRARAIRRRGE